MDHYLEQMIVFLAIAFFIFLICRELMCWYWKINKIVTLLEDIKSNLDLSNKKIVPQNYQENMANSNRVATSENQQANRMRLEK